MPTTNCSLLSLWSREVFGSFVTSIGEIVEDVGEIEVEEGQQLHLTNNLVLEIADIFVRSQLGSRNDAILCAALPVISWLRSPAASIILTAATKRGNQLRRQGEWQQAEATLR